MRPTTRYRLDHAGGTTRAGGPAEDTNQHCNCSSCSSFPDCDRRLRDVDCRCAHFRLEIISLFTSRRLTVPVHYFLHPSQGSPRTGAAVATLVLYFTFLVLVALAYFRLVHVLLTNNGLIPQNTVESLADLETNLEARTYHRPCAPTTIAEKPQDKDPGKTFLDHESILRGTKAPPGGIDDYYRRETFVCDAQGLPIWCPTCSNWKPDRTHHCSDVGRCVRKLDHFCPW